MQVKCLLILLWVCCLAESSLNLASTSDSQFEALLSGDWYSMLPTNMKIIRAQLIKELTPLTADHNETATHEMIRSMHQNVRNGRSHF